MVRALVLVVKLPPGLRFEPLGARNFEGPCPPGYKLMIYLLSVKETHYKDSGLSGVKDVSQLHGLWDSSS